jgi:hypothetical protein
MHELYQTKNIQSCIKKKAKQKAGVIEYLNEMIKWAIYLKYILAQNSAAFQALLTAKYKVKAHFWASVMLKS